MLCKRDSLLTISLGLSFLLAPNALPAGSTSSVSVAAANTLRQDRITSANWQQHPKIKAVRTVVESVNAGLRKGAFKISVRKFEECEPYEDSLRKMAVDSKGVVRRYEKQAGSEDSGLTWEHYYDEAGRLRFVFISGGASNGAQLEHRVYFDESGKRIWEEQKYVKGPEYFFPKVWPDDQNRKRDEVPPIQKSDPAKAFAAKSSCPEQTVRSKNKSRD